MIEIIDESKKRIKAIKKGKVVTKDVETAKRPKHLSHKKRMAIKKMVMAKKRKPMAMKKWRKSMKRRKTLITPSMKKRSSQIMSKRRSLQRKSGFAKKKEGLIFYGADNLFLAECAFNLTDIYGEQYEVNQGYLFDAYDNGFDVMIDIYNNDGELEYENVEILPQKIYTCFKENLVDVLYEEELNEDYEYDEINEVDEEDLEELNDLTTARKISSSAKGPKLSAADRKFLNNKLQDLVHHLIEKLNGAQQEVFVMLEKHGKR